jgi:tetratricopeptide (TPR) repeat protein
LLNLFVPCAIFLIACVLPVRAVQPAADGEAANEAANESYGSSFETFVTEPGWAAEELADDAPFDLDAAATCQAQLVEIAAGVGAFRADHDGAYPVWLSALAPGRLPDRGMLICPADPEGGDPLSTHARDPNFATSYLYELSPSEYEARRSQIRQYGGIVPIVRCLHHVDVPLAAYVGDDSAIGETTLSIGADLRVYAGRPEWREDRRIIDQLYADMRAALRAADTEALAAYSFGVMKLFNDEQRVELRRALEEATAGDPQGTVGAYQKLAGAYYAHANMPTVAIERYTRAAEALPEDAEVRFALGVLHGQAGDILKSTRALEEGLRLQPDTVDVGLTLARQYARDGRQDDLRHVYSLLQDHFRPDSLVHNYALGSVAYLIDDLETSRQALERVLRVLPPGMPATAGIPRYAITRLASIYERQGDGKGAAVLLHAIDPGMSQLGEAAAAIEGVGPLGAVTLDDYVGVPTAVAFWRSDNASCRAQIAFLEQLVKRLGREFAVIAVNVAPPDVRDRERLYATANISSGSVLNAPDIARAYAVISVPAVVLVDRDGIVRHRHLGHGPEHEGDIERHLRALVDSRSNEPTADE